MRHRSFSQFLCMAVLVFYGSAVVQAGQIITREDRDWAKRALTPEAQLDGVESSKSIAVLNFHNHTGQKRLDALQKGFALMLSNDLAKIESVVAIERTRTQAMLDEMHPGAGDLVDNETAPGVGKPLKAYYVVNGIIDEGALEQLEVTATLIDVPFGNVSSLPPAAGSIDELYRIQKDVLFNIVDGMNIYLPPAQKRSLEVPMSASTTALLAFFLGIDAADKRQYGQAAEMFTRALAEDPSLDQAREALQELTDLDLLHDEDPPVADGQPVPAAPADTPEMSNAMKIGLGVAVVAGGVAILAASGGSSGGGGGSAPPPDEEPTAAIDKTGVTCVSDAVIFSFSEPMNTSYGYAGSNAASFTVEGGWLDVQHYRVSWSNQDAFCDESPESVDIILNNFQSETGQALGGQTTFTVQFSDS